MAGAGQVGAALALWIRLRKDKELSEMDQRRFASRDLGIGEPLIYGVTLPLGRPFITACIGGGIGGAVYRRIVEYRRYRHWTFWSSFDSRLIANGHWLGYVFGFISRICRWLCGYLLLWDS